MPRICSVSVINVLVGGFAYTWLVVNPTNGQLITDGEAIDLRTNVLHHGLAGDQ